MKAKPEKPPGIVMPQKLKERPAELVSAHEKPAYAQEIAALQGEGTNKEVLMDKSSDHNTPSEVGSSGRLIHSRTSTEMQKAAHAALEVAAVQNFPDKLSSETLSE